MKELLKAIEIKKKYNKMPFREFIKEYEKHYNVKISNDIIESFEFTGLNNVDFLTTSYVNRSIKNKNNKK